MTSRLLQMTSSFSRHRINRRRVTSRYRPDLSSTSLGNEFEGRVFAQPTVSLERLGVVMEPQPGNLNEVEGVLNPATARGPDGELYLLPPIGRRRQLLPESDLLGCSSMSRAIQEGLNGWVLCSSPRLTMKGIPATGAE